MSNVIVKLENIFKNYNNKKKVIKGFDLEIYENEFLTILGPSGCGKTTILRMISGLEEVSSGKIYLNGEDVTDIPASKREVNTIFQNFALFSHLNIYDNVAFGLKIKKIDKEKINREVVRMLDLVKLKGYEKRFPRELSGGEQQRVAIARGLINKPKVLLLDEPLSSLDLKLKKEMQVELKRLQRKLGITFIYVTHNQEEALTMSDRILVLNKGKLEQLDTAENIYRKPKTKFVADFIGESNILKGKIINRVKDTISVKLESGDVVNLNTNLEFSSDDVFVMIRPENINIRESKNGNNLKVTIKDNIYNGTMMRIIAKYNDIEIKINVDSDKLYKENSEVTISFSDDEAVLIGDSYER